MTVRQAFTFGAVVAEAGLTVSPALAREYEETVHRGEAGAEACTWRDHEVDHPATIQLTPDPDLNNREVPFPHTDELTVCRCCAFERGHLYEEMLGECRSGGHVGVALRQDDGRWLS